MWGFSCIAHKYHVAYQCANQSVAWVPNFSTSSCAIIVVDICIKICNVHGDKNSSGGDKFRNFTPLWYHLLNDWFIYMPTLLLNHNMFTSHGYHLLQINGTSVWDKYGTFIQQLYVARGIFFYENNSTILKYPIQTMDLVIFS